MNNNIIQTIYFENSQQLITISYNIKITIYLNDLQLAKIFFFVNNIFVQGKLYNDFWLNFFVR